jgi:murein DD-endopeptidase MepM/ murein hydrolase activator NlpD
MVMPVPKTLLHPLVAPFRYTDLYGLPRSNTAGFHTGVDIAAATGTPVRAANDGVVEIAARGFANELGKPVKSLGGYGNQVWLRHRGYMTVYAHFNTVLVRKGQKVTRGQQIGTVGTTGISTGPHLHMEVRDTTKPQGRQWVDPLSVTGDGEENVMIRKNKVATKFNNKNFNGTKNVPVDIRTDFGLPDRVQLVRIEVFMKAGGVKVKDGAKKYAGQVSQRWGQKRDVIDVFPKNGKFFLDFAAGSTVANIGCLAYFE